jgi:DNA (cytosine-5)-methyltransferase 1
MKPNSVYGQIIKLATKDDKSIADTRLRLGQKGSGFQTYYVWPDDVMPTIRTKNDAIDFQEKAYIGNDTIARASTFPLDYAFPSDKSSMVGFICGMSVPPVMMKRVVTRLIEQGVFDYKWK